MLKILLFLPLLVNAQDTYFKLSDQDKKPDQFEVKTGKAPKLARIAYNEQAIGELKKRVTELETKLKELTEQVQALKTK